MWRRVRYPLALTILAVVVFSALFWPLLVSEHPLEMLKFIGGCLAGALVIVWAIYEVARHFVE